MVVHEEVNVDITFRVSQSIEFAPDAKNISNSCIFKQIHLNDPLLFRRTLFSSSFIKNDRLELKEATNYLSRRGRLTNGRSPKFFFDCIHSISCLPNGSISENRIRPSSRAFDKMLTNMQLLHESLFTKDIQPSPGLCILM